MRVLCDADGEAKLGAAQAALEAARGERQAAARALAERGAEAGELRLRLQTLVGARRYQSQLPALQAMQPVGPPK